MTLNSYNQGSVNLDVSKFIVNTKRNYLTPIAESQSITQQGFHILQKPYVQTTNNYSPNEGLGIIYVTRSNQITLIQRTDHNLLDIFSYIGGLATGLLAIIQLIVNQYNSYAFEIQLSYKLYSLNQQKTHQQKKQHKNTDEKLKQQPQNTYSMITNLFPLINICTFIKDKFPCFSKTVQIKNCRSELNKQLETQYLLRKINVFQNALLKLVRHSNITLQPKKLNKYRFQQASEFRKIFQFQQQEDNDNITNKTQKQDQKSKKLQERQYKGHLEIVLQSNFNIEAPDQYILSNKDQFQVNDRGREQQF